VGEKLKLNVKPFGECDYCSETGMATLANRGIVEHMTVFKRIDGHIHVHGPVKNESLIIEMIKAICRESGIDLNLADEEPQELEGPEVEVQSDED
jgi:hypothetical protein